MSENRLFSIYWSPTITYLAGNHMLHIPAACDTGLAYLEHLF